MSESEYHIAFVCAFVLNYVVVAVYRRRAQAGATFSLSEEPGWIRIGLRVSALVVFGYIVLHIVAPSLTRWSRLPFPDVIRLFGAGFALLVVPFLVHWSQRALGKNVSPTVSVRENHELVTDGPYRWVRHPLYTSGLLFFGSLGLIAGSWFLIAALGVVFLILSRRTIIEEEKLAERFGKAYREYQRQTGKYFPRLHTLINR